MSQKDLSTISFAKVEANRRNAQRSTGPKSEDGKRNSRNNAFKHGILSSDLIITTGQGAEDSDEFAELLDALRLDLSPFGKLEEILVEKIAICFWRQKRALRCEAGLVRRRHAHNTDTTLEVLKNSLGMGENPKLKAITDHLSLPASSDLDKILRYETSIQRQLAYAVSQLERLQRARKGESVPAPVSVQLSTDQ